MKFTLTVFVIVILATGHCSADSDFCSAKRYERLQFISQSKYGEYIIAGSDDLFYQGTWNGTVFASIVGPFNVTVSFKGANSVAQFLNSTPKGFASVLFIEPGQSQNVLQFLNDKVWFIDGSKKAVPISWPANCPPVIGNIINRSIQPHIVLDYESYYRNLTVDLTTGQVNCSERYPVKAFQENFKAVMAVDAPLSGRGADPKVLTDTRVYRWLPNGDICKSYFPPSDKATFVCTGPSWRLPNNWELFGCPNPNAASDKPGALSAGKVAMIVGIVLAVVILLIVAAYFAKRLFHSSKDVLVSSQIQ